VFADELGGRHRARMEYTSRQWSTEFGDTLGGRNCASLEIHMEAVIEHVWRCCWRPCLREFGDALAGHDRVRLEEYIEAVPWEAVVWEGGTMGA